MYVNLDTGAQIPIHERLLSWDLLHPPNLPARPPASANHTVAHDCEEVRNIKLSGTQKPPWEAPEPQKRGEMKHSHPQSLSFSRG